ncbi:MAG: DUF6152 family protein [Parvibaculaceae bacterium]
MRRVLAMAALLLASTAAATQAHHGWGSYDSARKFTITAAIGEVMWQNPHAHIMLPYEGATWEITLAPISRMERRGLTADMLKAGTEVSVEGYPSTRNEHEMRAERITVAGNTVELR